MLCRVNGGVNSTATCAHAYNSRSYDKPIIHAVCGQTAVLQDVTLRYVDYSAR